MGWQHRDLGLLLVLIGPFERLVKARQDNLDRCGGNSDMILASSLSLLPVPGAEKYRLDGRPCQLITLF